MLRYLLYRFASMLPVVILVTAGVFGMLFLAPGDPLTLLVPADSWANVSPERLEEIRHGLGLDRPVPIQYADWLWNAVHGDLGQSIRSGRRVSTMILDALPVTAELCALTLVFSLIIAFPVGILTAYRANQAEDYVLSGVALMGISTPNFWLGIMLMLVFAYWLGLVPALGFVRFSEDPLRNLQSLILPALTLSGEQLALSMRIIRSSFLEVLRAEYIVAARAKGLKESTVLVRHALKNAMLPVVTVLGLQVGSLLSGAFIIETIFALPGIGKIVVDAIFVRDFPVVQGGTLFTALMFLGLNLIVDLLYSYIDPRISYTNATARDRGR